MAKDVHIITGMDAIINKENTRPGVDFKELERELVSGGMITKKIRDPQDRFNEELKEAARKLGISFGDTKQTNTSSTPSTSYSRAPTADPTRSSLPSVSLDNNYTATPAQADEGTDSESGDDDQAEPTSSAPDLSDRYEENRFNTSERPRFGGDLATRTMEQERRLHIDSVVGNSGSGFSFENEKREDNKMAMLADIDSLMSSLSEDNTDLSRIPRVDRNSSFEEVESVLKMLRHKNDHTRYCSFAEEFLIFGAYALEELFDGKRKWFGRYQPDLTGWHNHVNVKIKRMQHDTSKIVSEVMQDYNIGSGARLLLELIPSMILYSKMRKQQHGEPGLFSDVSMADASRNLRSL